MNYRITFTACAAALASVALWLSPTQDSYSAADGQPNQTAVKAFMQGKLDSSKAVLEGLVNEDYKKIQQAADAMRVMSQQAEWNVIEGEDYKKFSLEFRNYCEKLSSAAKVKNVDSATLAYVQLTITCVSCHKFARGVRVTEVGAPRLHLGEFPVASTE